MEREKTRNREELEIVNEEMNGNKEVSRKRVIERSISASIETNSAHVAV